jgi:hypothetical protein
MDGRAGNAKNLPPKVPGESSGARHQKKRAAQQRLLTLVAQGSTVKDALLAVGRTASTMQQWREHDPEFAKRVDILRGRLNRESEDVVSFADFRLAYFGFETYWHHKLIVDAIEKAKAQSITLILVPPEWGKSTLLEDYCCYKLGPVDPDHRICVISESTTQSRKMVRRVENRMTDEAQFSEFIRQHGPFKASDPDINRPWNADFFTVLRRSGDERDPSMEARGAGSKLYGSRYDLVLLDDIQSVQTLSSTDSLLDFFRSDLLTRPGIEGRIIIVGTRIGPGDFYERILEEDLVDDFIKVPALDAEMRSNFPKRQAPNGKLVGWDEEDLAIRRHKVGEEIWARVYMQEPQSKVGQTFTEAIVGDCYDHKRGLGLHYDLDYDGILASVDPGLGAGYCSMKVGAMSPQRLSIIDSFNKTGLGRYEDIFDQMEVFTRMYHPMAWVVETNAMQKGLGRDDRLRAMAERHGFRIIEHNTAHNKSDPQVGVASMAGAFMRKEISLPYGDEEARRKMMTLVKQLYKWRPDVPSRYLIQDEVMSLWFNWKWWQTLKRSMQIDTSAWNRPAMPMAPTNPRVGLGTAKPVPAAYST